MALKEILNNQGIAEETVNAVLEEMKKNGVYESTEPNVDIRYGKLKADHDGLTAKHNEALALIDELKKSGENNATLQEKLTAYESTIAQLNAQMEAERLENAIKLALIDAKATDIGYMTFKLKENNADIKFDDAGNISGIEDMLTGLKTQYPNMFENAGGKQVSAHRLEDHNNGNSGGMTKSEFLKKPYAERAEFARENPDAYKTLMGR